MRTFIVNCADAKKIFEHSNDVIFDIEISNNYVLVTGDNEQLFYKAFLILT